MSIQRPTGTTPLDRLRAHYDDTSLTCPDCGYEDERGAWRAEATGRRVRYHHECPSCGSITVRTIELGGE